MAMWLEPNLGPDAQGRRHIRGAEHPEDLLAEMAGAGWTGPRVKAFKDDLWTYGWDVLRGLIRDRQIRTIPAGMPPVMLSEESWAMLNESTDERHEVVLDTLERAIPKFLADLEGGKYDPRRSALGTFFIGCCAKVFRDVARGWQNRRSREQYELASFDWDGVFGGLPIDDVERRLDLRKAVADILRGVTPPQRAALIHFYLEDRSQGEVAALMKITAKAVDGHLFRARRAAYSTVSPANIRWLLDSAGYVEEVWR